MLKSEIEEKINGYRNQLGRLKQQIDNLNNQLRFLNEAFLKTLGKIEVLEEVKEGFDETVEPKEIDKK